MLAEAAEHHAQSTGRLEADIAESARIRAEAASEAEQVRGNAIAEAENRIATSRKQAAAITARTQQEFSWRKQQLRRETELLQQRKQAVLSQLASLSELAQQTASSFPDLDEDADQPTAGTGSRGSGRAGQPDPDQQPDEPAVEEDGSDRTVLKRYSAPSLPADAPTPPAADEDTTKEREQPAPTTEHVEQSDHPGQTPQTAGAADRPAPAGNAPATPEGSREEHDSDVDVPMDGEPTLLAAPGRLPSSGPAQGRPGQG